MKMQLDRLNREVDIKFTRKDAQDMRKVRSVSFSFFYFCIRFLSYTRIVVRVHLSGRQDSLRECICRVFNNSRACLPYPTIVPAGERK